jgi:hypothetical protein
MLLSGCAAPHSGGSEPPDLPDTYLPTLALVRDGMYSDSLETIVGEPLRISDGILYIRADDQRGSNARTVDIRHPDRYESWEYQPSRIDTLHSPTPVTLYDDAFNDHPEHGHNILVKYYYCVVIDKSTRRVVEKGFYPSGFVDEDGDLWTGEQSG